MPFSTRVSTLYPRKLWFVALGGFRASPSRGLSQLTMGFEEVKKWYVLNPFSIVKSVV